MISKNKKIKLVLGGDSSEREVSIASGLSIYDSIKDEFETELIYLDNDFKVLSKKLKKNDIVFNALHGGYGENGELQLYLENLEICFTGSDSKTCKIAMSKNSTKEIAVKENIPTAHWTMKYKMQKEINISFPLVVKPDDQGSTIGLSIVVEKSGLDAAIKLAKQYSENIMIEKYIPGREITVGIIDGVPLPIVEIIPKHNFYDYKAKYTKGKSEYICPANIEKGLSNCIKKDALKIFNSINCTKYARVDFRLDRDKHYFLELNTHPGMTDTSLLPMAAKEFGIDFKELIKKIIKK